MIERHLRLLIIEDDQNVVKSISRMLFRQKISRFDILHAESLNEGLVCLSENNFDIILLDLTLPDSMGISTLQAVSKKCNDSSIIVMTGKNDEKAAIDALKSGAQDFIYKPSLDKDHLISSILYANERKNIDELTKVNRQILEKQKSVIQEERLKVLLQLSENTFHEINQPVKAIRSSIDIIKTEKTDNEIIAGHLNRMETACQQIEDTLRRIELLKNEDNESEKSNLTISSLYKTVNILAVEDSGFSFKFLKKLLEKEKNVKLSQAKSLKEAWKEIENDKYDLIFLDYYLPDGEGIDFLHKLKEKKVEIPVIVITGKGDEMVASRMIQAGAYEYIPKDAINRNALFSAINKALTKFNLHREIKLAQDKMVKMSTRDEMTGLYNYRYFIENLQQELSASKRYKYDLVVCMIDIDHFKKINDDFGHPAGDDVLVNFGRLLQENTRESDLPCRYGGEEFGVILTHTSIKNAYTVMERFRKVIEKTEFSNKGKNFPVTVSIGLTILNGENKTTDQLIDEADQALYRAKKSGRNKTIIFQN